jgi:hypothetical protein
VCPAQGEGTTPQSVFLSDLTIFVSKSNTLYLRVFYFSLRLYDFCQQIPNNTYILVIFNPIYLYLRDSEAYTYIGFSKTHILYTELTLCAYGFDKNRQLLLSPIANNIFTMSDAASLQTEKGHLIMPLSL